MEKLPALVIVMEELPKLFPFTSEMKKYIVHGAFTLISTDKAAFLTPETIVKEPDSLDVDVFWLTCIHRI